MPLEAVDITFGTDAIPSDVTEFLHEAKVRIDHFRSNSHDSADGFVPSDYLSVYQALRAITEQLTPSTSLCEWGSGFGVVSCMASMLNLQACGIEIEDTLFRSARQLASDFNLATEFANGSFVPAGCQDYVEETYEENNQAYSWLVQSADDGHQKLGRAIDDFDIVFAYPWPGEEHLIEHVFENYAAPDAILLMQSDILALTVQRHVATTVHQ